MRLAWAITIAYGVLYCGILIVVSRYWLMLPISLRAIAAVGLLALAILGALRIARSYRTRPAAAKAEDERQGR